MLFFLLLVIVVIVVILFLKRDTIIVRKLWGYLLIAFQIIFYVLLKIFYSLKRKIFKNTTNRVSTSEVLKETDVDNKLKDLGNRLEEVELVAKVEVSVIKKKKKILLEQLEDANKIKDKDERRKRLYTLIDDL